MKSVSALYIFEKQVYTVFQTDAVSVFQRSDWKGKKKMKIIVAGDGQVGIALTRLLSQEGHELVTINSNRAIIERDMQDLDVISIHGNCAAMATLTEANVKQADVLVAATSADETNLLSCLTARRMNPGLHTIARVRNPEYIEQLYMMRDEFGLSLIINPEREAAREMYRLMQIPGFLKRETFAKGRVEIVELKIEENSLLDNVILHHLPHVLGNLKILVCAVVRDGHAFIPNGDTTLRRGDHIYVTAPMAALSGLMKKMDITKRKIRHALLVGGGRVGYYLAQNLINAGVRVKVIEQNMDRCLQLNDILPGAAIIHADGSSPAVLESEGLTETDAFVTLTGLDEQNVITSMYGTAQGVPTVITMVNRMATAGMLENLPVGSVVSPKELCCENIVQYVRAMGNQAGAANSVHRIADGRVEALEFVINKHSRHIGDPLIKMHLKRNVLIACITCRGETILPNGSSSFNIGDTVVVVTSRDEPILQFNDIFA